MSLFDRIRGRPTLASAAPAAQPGPSTMLAHLLGGADGLEVVGESNYQNPLWAISGGCIGDRIRHKVVAVLVPQPDNPHDPNTISVQIEGNLVGYLARDLAGQYLPGLLALMARYGTYVALEGEVVGGGYHSDGPGRLGVWLEHDPEDFGLAPPKSAHWTSHPTQPAHAGTMRTGFSEAWLTDVEDDSYDLSWFSGLPETDAPAISRLRTLLSAQSDPIDRHFQFVELEKRLYRSRDISDTALDEFDDTCEKHDLEMPSICKAFVDKWGKLPLLETYRQMAIRQQKKQDWAACIWWTERGLALYGNSAARVDAVEYLMKRRDRALSKLEMPLDVPRSTAADNGIATLTDEPPPWRLRGTTQQ